MEHNEIGLFEALVMLEPFAPVKVSFNGVLLFNDYDGNEDESAPLLVTVQRRLWHAERYVVSDINVSIVEFHHGVVELWGRYEEEK